MGVDPITGGLIGWVCGKLADKGLSYLLGSDEFRGAINRAVKEWAKGMRGEMDVDPAVFFGPLESGEDGKEKYYDAIQAKLLKREWPEKSEWHQGFMERWGYVKRTVKKPQAFFRLEESQASAELERLAEAVYGVCRENEAIFKSAVVGKLDRHEDKLDAIKDTLENAFATGAIGGDVSGMG